MRPDAYGALTRGIGAAATSRELQRNGDEEAARCLLEALNTTLAAHP